MYGLWDHFSHHFPLVRWVCELHPFFLIERVDVDDLERDMSDPHFNTHETLIVTDSFGTDLDADNLASPLQEYLYSPDTAPLDKLPQSTEGITG